MSSLTKKDLYGMLVSSIVLSIYMWSAATVGINQETALEKTVFEVISSVAEIMKMLVKNFAFPISVLTIFIYALSMARKSKTNKPVVVGKARQLAVIGGIGIFVAGVIITLPEEPTSSYADLLYWEKAVYFFISAFAGSVFLYLLYKFTGVFSSLLISLMTGGSLLSFYFYYLHPFVQPYLLLIAPGVFVGGVFYGIVEAEREEIKIIKET